MEIPVCLYPHQFMISSDFGYLGSSAYEVELDFHNVNHLCSMNPYWWHIHFIGLSLDSLGFSM